MADEPIKPEQKIEPKKDTVRITLPPKIGTPGAAPRPAAAPPMTPTVRLPSPAAVTAAKAQEATPIQQKESDTKTIPGGKKRETQTIKKDTSKVKTSPTPAAARTAAPPAAPSAPAAAPRPTTVRLPTPAEVQRAAEARQPVAPPAPVAPAAPASAGWVGAVALVAGIVTIVAAVMLFLQYKSLGS